MRKLLSVILFIFIPSLLQPQSNLSMVKDNSFIIDINCGTPAYKDTQKGTVKIRDYYEYTDPSESGSYKLPYKEILIAIPPNEKISLSILSKSENTIERILPKLNPFAERQSDSSIVYKEIDFSKKKSVEKNNSLIEVIGYSWFRDFYCAKVRIKTHTYVENESKLIEIKSIKLEVKLSGNDLVLPSSPIKLKSKFDEELKNLISNYQIAEQFRGGSKRINDDTTANWIDYNNTYVKIGIAADGLYRLSKTDLEALGISTSTIDPRTFKIFESGVEQRIYVSGESDGIFNAEDYIEFWGTKNYSKTNYRIINSDNQDYNEYMNRYTDTTYYFLTWGNKNGERAFPGDSFVNGIADSLNYYTYKQHFEKNLMLQNNNDDETVNNYPGWKKNKTWDWDWVGVSSYNYDFTAEDIYPGKKCNLYFKLISGGSSLAKKSHNLSLSINNVVIDSQVVNRFDQVLLKGEINSSLLRNNNVIKLSNYTNGTTTNFLARDWYEIEYPRVIKLNNDSLYIQVSDDISSALRVVKVDNVQSDNWVIYKVNPTFKRIDNYRINKPYLYFTDTVESGNSYIIVAQSKIAKPQKFSIKKFTNLRASNKQVDYIAITNQKFGEAARNYVEQVSQLYNINSIVTNVEDIFDEFSFGYPYPEAIKAYVKYSFSNWPEPKPAYLVLIGDANYDYKRNRYYNSGVIGGGNYVPSYGYPVSDNWFAIWDENAIPIPQLKVGRIPINSAQELSTYLSKIQNNFSSSYGEWNKKSLFFSGGKADDSYEINQLKSANDSIIAKYVSPKPIAGKYTHFYKTTNPLSDFGPYTQEQINKSISEGGLFISYLGHSGTATWDNSISDITQLKNSVNRYPLITDFGCSTNKFAEPDIVCFGERFLLNTDGQAIAYVGNSSLGFVNSAINAAGIFYKLILKDSVNEIGGAFLKSKINLFSEVGTSDIFKIFSLTNTLLGDPAVKLKIPQKPNLNITQSSISFSNSIINDEMDSVSAVIVVNNWGSSIGKGYAIEYEHYINNQLIESKKIFKILPDYKDTIIVWLKTKNLAGNHSIIVKLDVDNAIDEIYEDDNQTQINFNVYPLNLRDLLSYTLENGAIDKIYILNPVVGLNDSFQIKYQLAENENFLRPQEGSVSIGTFYSVLNLPSLSANKRYWLKYKIDQGTSDYSQVKSFLSNSSSKFLLGDSISFQNQVKINTEYSKKGITLSKDSINISVISAGYYAGGNCIIAKNRRNLLSNTFFSGMGIAVFNEKTMEVDTVQWFALFNQPDNMKKLVELINSIKDGKIVALGVASDAANNITADLVNAIKSLGSTKINQLVFRGSWALIGKKGALPGDVIEMIKGPYDGLISIDSSFSIQNTDGSLITKVIGPASTWGKIKLSSVIPSGSKINIRPLGLKINGSIDTLDYVQQSDTVININHIAASKYPSLKLLIEFHSSNDYLNPILNLLSVDYTSVPELGTNYQGVFLSKDSVMQGDNVLLKFDVFNAGEAQADSFRVKVDLVKSDNTKKLLMDSIITRLSAFSKKHYEINYTSNNYDGYGKMYLQISIDNDNRIIELYKDNNIYQVPFYVKRDTNQTAITPTSLDVTYDGVDISNGDFISASPHISMSLNYPIWFSCKDTNAFQIYLDDSRVSHSQLTIQADTISRKVIYNYLPKLVDGEHTLSIYGKNIDGVVEDKPGYKKSFQVSNEMKLLYVYNYPNPLKNETYFTFKLGQIPEEMRIKIYTVAGRLIKDIKINGSELNYDFNKIYWNGRDEDGDILANGVYIYKITAKKDGKIQSVTQKLAIVR